MKQTLVIGSTVVDILLNIPFIPRTGEDVNIASSEYRIGGCAYNVYKTLTLFDSPALLCSPVGSGVFGRMVRENLEKEGLKPFVTLEKENGCCYCLIESGGERTFLSYHGAEYLFSRSWMNDIDMDKTGSVFICGLEVEEETGNEIVDFVYEYPELELYFAAGPRIMGIPPDRMEKLLARRDKQGKGPLLHLNESEAFNFTGEYGVEKGAEYLASKTGNSVVITMGENGCYCLEKAGVSGAFIPAHHAKVVDTVGAGDAHCGALIASLKNGVKLEEACVLANKAGAAVVSVRGAILMDQLPVVWPPLNTD